MRARLGQVEKLFHHCKLKDASARAPGDPYAKWWETQLEAQAETGWYWGSSDEYPPSLVRDVVRVRAFGVALAPRRLRGGAGFILSRLLGVFVPCVVRDGGACIVSVVRTSQVEVGTDENLCALLLLLGSWADGGMASAQSLQTQACCGSAFLFQVMFWLRGRLIRHEQHHIIST